MVALFPMERMFGKREKAKKGKSARGAGGMTGMRRGSQY